MPVISIAGIEFTAHYSAVDSAVEVKPAGIPNARAVKFDHTTFDHPDELPLDGDKASTKQYGALTRLENRVHDLHKDIELAKTDLASAEKRLAALEAKASTTFEREDELDQKIKERDSLREVLAAVDQSDQAKQVRRERDQRMEQHGRDPLWTLRLNPTEGYAENVEHTTVEETIARAKRDDCLAQFRYGLISEDELTTQLARWTPLEEPEEEQNQAPEVQVNTSLIDSICGTDYQPSADAVAAASTAGWPSQAQHHEQVDHRSAGPDLI